MPLTSLPNGQENQRTFSALDHSECKKTNPQTLQIPNTVLTLLSTGKIPVQTKVLSGMEYTNLGRKPDASPLESLP